MSKVQQQLSGTGRHAYQDGNLKGKTGKGKASQKAVGIPAKDCKGKIS
jgi:hypothetical protein